MPEEESGNISDNNSSLNTKYEQENDPEIAITYRVEQLVKLWRSKLQTGPWGSLLDPKDRKEINTRQNGLITFADEAMDERNLVEKPLQALLIHAALDATLADAYSVFLTKVKDIIKKMTADRKIRGIRTTEEISSKQTGRILFKKVKNLFLELEPANEHEARIDGFSGQVCPNCKCRRCERVPDASGDRWYECPNCGPEKHFIGKPIPAYKDPHARTIEMGGKDGNSWTITAINEP